MNAAQKRDIFAEWLEAQAAKTKDGLIVETRFRPSALSIYADLGAQQKIMGGARGANIYYADVLLRGNSVPIGRTRDVKFSHEYDVRLWLELDEDGDTQATFDALTYGDDGIITALLNTGELTTTSGTTHLDADLQQAGLGEQVAIDELHDQPEVLAHLLTFTITLR